jgi:hypothetical protein
MTTFDFRSPAQSDSFSADPFSARYGARLPRDLRTQAAGMTWTDFEAAYVSGPHLVELAAWASHRLGATSIVFDATIVCRGASYSRTTTSSGPIAALTGILYDFGINVEILALHQQLVEGRVATFIHAERNGRRHWAMAIAPGATESSLRAVIAAANFLAA